jgi:hypothetical protein
MPYIRLNTVREPFDVKTIFPLPENLYSHDLFLTIFKQNKEKVPIGCIFCDLILLATL